MRQVAGVASGHEPIRRLMIYEDEHGCYLFGYDTPDDGPGLWDCWFVDAEEAKRACQEEYGVVDAEWSDITDPQPGCQHDIIAPTIVIRHSDGGLSLRAA